MKKYISSFLLLISSLAACTSMPMIPSSSITIPLPTKTVTLIPSITPTETSTIASYPTQNPYPLVVKSPNGKLSAKIHINWDNLYDKPAIEVWDQNSSIIWRVAYQGNWDPFVFPQKSMAIYGWSLDSSKLYFYYSLSYDTGVPTFAYVRDLQSLDIDTGKSKFLLPLNPNQPTAFAFSPDMNKIAFISDKMVGIFDLTTGHEKKVKILTDNPDDAGWIFYSPSGKKIIYHTLVSQDDYSILLEPQTMNQEIIYMWPDFHLANYTFDGWTSNEYPRYLDYDNSVVVIDLNTLNQIIIGTATPKP